MDGLLIERVKERLELYDVSHVRYSDNIHKRNMWNEVGKSLNTSGEYTNVIALNVLKTVRNTLNSGSFVIPGI